MAQQRKPPSLADDVAEQVEDLSLRRDILAAMGGQKSGYEDSAVKRRKVQQPAAGLGAVDSSISVVPEEETDNWWLAFLRKALSPSNYLPKAPKMEPPQRITGKRG